MQVNISFSDSLSGDLHKPLRDRIIRLGRKAVVPPTWVDTLLGLAERPPDPNSDWNQVDQFLLLDFHRFFLYRHRSGGRAPVTSVVRLILDGYPVQPFNSLVSALGEHPFRFLPTLDALDLLPRLWRTQRPDTILSCDYLSGQVEELSTQIHPEMERIQVDDPTTRVAPRLQDCWTDSSLRSAPPADLSDLVSPILGPIRYSDLTTDSASLPFATTLISWDNGKRKELCFGKGLRASTATSVAMCEAAERFQIALCQRDTDLVYGTFAELKGRAVDPRCLFFGRSPLCNEDLLPIYSEDLPLYWTSAWSPNRKDSAMVPAQEIWFNTSKMPGENMFIQPTTSGCAEGGSLEEAALFALLEAIERDSFLTMWYLRRPCHKIDLTSITYEPFNILRQRWEFSFRDYNMFFYDLTNDIRIPSVGAMAVRHSGTGPYLFFSAATALDFERACFSALKDLTGFRPELSAERRDEISWLFKDSTLIDGPSGHFGLYANDEAFDRFNFLVHDTTPAIDIRVLQQQSIIRQAEKYNLREVINKIVLHLDQLEAGAFFKDISHPIFASRGLFCVKAVTPGLYPLWFGGRTRRFATTDRLRRLAMMFRGKPLRDLELNLEPHPLS